MSEPGVIEGGSRLGLAQEAAHVAFRLSPFQKELQGDRPLQTKVMTVNPYIILLSSPFVGDLRAIVGFG